MIRKSMLEVVGKPALKLSEDLSLTTSISFIHYTGPTLTNNWGYQFEHRLRFSILMQYKKLKNQHILNKWTNNTFIHLLVEND